MKVADDPIQAGRDAIERRAWQEANDLLTEADRQGRLTGEGLGLLAETAWWLGEPEVLIDTYERAYGALIEEGDPESAAMMAFRLAHQFMQRLSVPMASGWLSRAETLTADLPDSLVRGWTAWGRGFMAMMIEHDLATAVERFDEALRIEAVVGDRSLHARTLISKAQVFSFQGRFAEAASLMDEAMVAAVGGELDVDTTGQVYCAMIGMCSHMGDYRRSAEWTEATTRWCERNSIPGFRGICRIHRAELLRLRGEWNQAEQECRDACDELPRFNLNYGLGYAFYEIGEIRRRMGDLDGAEEAYSRALEFAHDSEPGLSLVRMAQGKLDVAAAGIRRALANPGLDVLSRFRYLVPQAEIAFEMGDLETAAAASAELDAVVGDHGATALRAVSGRVRGTFRLASGDPDGAVADLRRARQDWQDVGAPFEVAEVRVLLGKAYHVLGDIDSAMVELKAARSTFERLGATLASISVGEILGEIAASAASPERVKRAFMFTDIEKSTDLVGAIGDEAWEGLLSWHDQKLRSLFASGGGEVAHHTGDGFFVAFEDTASALRCAVAVQRALAEHRREHGFAPLVRVGVHAGEATRRGSDYSGGEVHTAARIAAAAEGGQILASEDTLADAPEGSKVSGAREIELKGITGPVRVAQLDWR